MIVDKILPLLDKVKKKGDNSWIARCPAHDDKNPSLAITEKEGKVLLHCFSHHCDVSDIVHAVGVRTFRPIPRANQNRRQQTNKEKKIPRRSNS